MVASMVPAKRTGVYMGILNMMIVVPMLIETVTFGWIYKYLLDNKGSNAIMLAGALLAVGGIAMLWVNPPDEADESPIMPLGSKRSITVYDRVVVGSDGTPTSLYAVDRAAEVAQAAQAKLIVVAAYREGDSGAAPSPAKGVHRDIYGAREGPAGVGEVDHRAHQGTGEIHRTATCRGRPGAGTPRHRRPEPREPDRGGQPWARRQRGGGARLGPEGRCAARRL